jgi:phospho-N-acetylmuramoyl-pentapeptide-transferase
MLYLILGPFHRFFGYISVRVGLAGATAFVFAILAGPLVINWLKKRQIGQTIRDDGPETHLVKEGTPTMG